MGKINLIKINNSKEAARHGKWENPGASFYNKLLDSFHYEDIDSNSIDAVNNPKNRYPKDFLEEAYLIAPINKIKNSPHEVTPFSRSGCKYPHHIIFNNELAIHVEGLQAAYKRAVQQGIFKGKVKEHLERHYKELGLYDDSTMKTESTIEENFLLIETYIEERSHGNLKQVEDIKTQGHHMLLYDPTKEKEKILKNNIKKESVIINENSNFKSYMGKLDEIEYDYFTEDIDLSIEDNSEEPVENREATDTGKIIEDKEKSLDVPPEVKAPIPESQTKQIERLEHPKNGVRRKKLYIEFIKWGKEINPKNVFGSVFDSDAFTHTYQFVPNEMRFFYRISNPMLVVLQNDLTFFALAELRKLNAKNNKLSEIMIFAATNNDMRVFNNKDKKVYFATEENNNIKLGQLLGHSFDEYIQALVNKGDILNEEL